MPSVTPCRPVWEERQPDRTGYDEPACCLRGCGLNASLVTILGLEQETLSARPAEKLRGWSPIPAGLRSSRKASAAVAASLAAMTCGFVALYLNGISIDRLGHRDGATTVLRDETPALASPRDGRSPAPSQPSVLSGSVSAPLPDVLASSMPVPPRSPRISAEGAKPAGTSSRPEACDRSKRYVPPVASGGYSPIDRADTGVDRYPPAYGCRSAASRPVGHGYGGCEARQTIDGRRCCSRGYPRSSGGATDQRQCDSRATPAMVTAFGLPVA